MDDENLLLNLNTEVSERLGFITILMSAFLIFGLFGNVTVLSVYLSNLKCLKNKWYLPICIIVDMIATVISSTFFITITQMFLIYPSDALCKTFYVMVFFSLTISGLFVVFIALDRYFKVCKPLESNIILDKKHHSFVGIILVSLCCSVPLAEVAGLKKTQILIGNKTIYGHICFHGESGMHILGVIHLSFVCVIFTGILLSSGALYICIGKTLYQKIVKRKIELRTSNKSYKKSKTSNQGRERLPGNRQRQQKQPEDILYQRRQSGCNLNLETDSCTTEDGKNPTKHVHIRSVSLWRKVKRQKSKNNFNAMFIVMYIVYSVSYIPPMLMFLIGKLDTSYYTNVTSSTLCFVVLCTSLFIISHVANPYIYAIFDMSFRKQLKQKCKMDRTKCLECFHNVCCNKASV